MSSNTSMYACPKCGNPNTHMECRLDGFCYCPDCQHRWKIGASQPKPTVFETITQSEEVLAEKLVYKIENIFEFGQTIIVHWYSTIVNGIFETKTEALVATMAKLKEVYNETTSN